MASEKLALSADDRHGVDVTYDQIDRLSGQLLTKVDSRPIDELMAFQLAANRGPREPGTLDQARVGDKTIYMESYGDGEGYLANSDGVSMTRYEPDDEGTDVSMSMSGRGKSEVTIDTKSHDGTITIKDHEGSGTELQDTAQMRRVAAKILGTLRSDLSKAKSLHRAEVNRREQTKRDADTRFNATQDKARSVLDDILT